MTSYKERELQKRLDQLQADQKRQAKQAASVQRELDDERSRNLHYNDLKARIGGLVVSRLGGDELIEIDKIEEDHLGPKGGYSFQIKGRVRKTIGHPWHVYAINIYCDKRTDQDLSELLLRYHPNFDPRYDARGDIIPPMCGEKFAIDGDHVYRRNDSGGWDDVTSKLVNNEPESPIEEQFDDDEPYPDPLDMPLWMDQGF